MQNKDRFGVAKALARLKAEGAFEAFDKLAFPNGVPVVASTKRSQGQLAVLSSFADGEDDGGLWISPSGKVIDVQGISHAEFASHRPNLFGISQADEDSIFAQAQADEGVMDFDEYLIVFLMKKGWTRIRVNDDNIFIDIPAGRQYGKRLSWAADALLDIGRSPNDSVCIETYQDGRFLTESPATLKSLWSGVNRKL